MPNLLQMYETLIENMDVKGLDIPFAAVKFFRGDDVPISQFVLNYHPKGLTLTACQALKQATLGDAVCLTKKTIGCVAAAIALGFIDRDETKPLDGSRVYTDLMEKQYKDKQKFIPPSPKDFTDGIVYACKDAGRDDFALFGNNDAGRYKTVSIAKHAVNQMSTIDPSDTKAVFFYPKKLDCPDITPDVIVMSIRPVELTRFIQAYQYNTGKRINASMGGLRVVADLIARPYITKQINVSTYCLGARLIAQYGPNRMGIGMPFNEFEIIVKGMSDSRTGFPFHMYPGAKQELY